MVKSYNCCLSILGVFESIIHNYSNNYDYNFVRILKDVYAQRIFFGFLSLRRLVSEDSYWKVAWRQKFSYL